MSEHADADKNYSLEEAVKALKSLRQAGNLGPEQFPIQAFVGMISDEVQALREKGWSDDQIAAHVRENSTIDITGNEIAENYATEEQRHGG